MTHRIGFARSCMNLMEKRIWKSSIRLNTKLRLHQTYVVPVLLYGCETWSTTKYLCDHIDAFYTWAIRKSSEYLTPVIWSILKSWYISGCQPLSHTITITDRRQQLVRWRSSLFSHISKTKASFGLLETERKTQPCVATCNWGGFEATEYQPLVCMEDGNRSRELVISGGLESMPWEEEENNTWILLEM